MSAAQRRLSAFVRAVKSLNYDEVQNLVREATSNDPVSAPDELIWKVIHAASLGSNNFAEVSDMLWRRIHDAEHPLHVYKGLTLLYHLLQHGDNKKAFRDAALLRLQDIQDLKQYTYLKKTGTLVADIRRAAATIEDMLLNPFKVVKKPTSSVVVDAPSTEPEEKGEPLPDPPVAIEPPPPRQVKKKPATTKKPRRKQSQPDAAPPPQPQPVTRPVRAQTQALPPRPDPVADPALAQAFIGLPVPAPKQKKPQVNVGLAADPFAGSEENPFKTAQQDDNPFNPKFFQKSPSSTNNLIGDLGSDFDKLPNKPGTGALDPRFASFPIEHKRGLSTSSSNLIVSVTPPAPQPMALKFVDESVTPALATAPPVKSKPVIKLLPSVLSELGVYARYINSKLSTEDNAHLHQMEYLPLETDGNDLLTLIDDGVLLSKLVNFVAPSTIDERVVNIDVKGETEKQQNVNLVLNAIQSLGIRTFGLKTLDITKGAPPKTATALVGLLVKQKLLENVNVRAHPELVKLVSDQESKLSTDDLVSMSPENLLLNWFHFHLRKYGKDREKIDLRDSECYAYLINSIMGSMSDQFPYPPIDIEALLREPDLEKRAEIILDRARDLGVDVELAPADIVGGNPRLNLAFTAALFNVSTGISADVTSHEDSKLHRNMREAIEKATRLVDDSGASREERAFRMWINSLGIDDLYVTNLLGGDLMDGLALLRLLDHIEPGLVEWKKVEAKPNSVFKKVSNCNYAIELGKKLGFSLVGVGGEDIVGGNSKLILAFIWQLMRHHVLKVVNEVRRSKFGDGPQGMPKSASSGALAVSDKQIMEWCNQKILKAQSSMKSQGLAHLATTPVIQSFGDKSLDSSRYFLDLLWCAEPRVVDWSLVTPAASPEDKMLNALYAISVARKLGATIFLLPEDIVEVRQKMVFSFLAAIMALF